MLTRATPDDWEHLIELYRFDVIRNNESTFKGYADWCNYMVADNERCWIVTFKNHTAFFVKDLNFFLMMKLAMPELACIPRGHNFK